MPIASSTEKGGDMAGLKPVIDKIKEVVGPCREFYEQKDGKFVLQLDGGHPLEKKVAEFRASNIALLKKRDPLKAKLADVDPEEYEILKAKAVAGDSSDIVALKMQLVETKSARAAVLHVLRSDCQ
jgi:hypothetical protein